MTRGQDGASPHERVDSPTEQRNPRTLDIDTLPTLELLRRINAEDATVPEAVAAGLPQLARLVDLAAERVTHGGRIHYVGAGTSGRVAAGDAAELAPTFGLDERMVVAHHAGGSAALDRAHENVEDSEGDGARDLGEVTDRDVVVGVAASGRTPYVAGALRRAREAGAVTALVSANPAAPLAALADVHVCADTGPEVIAGSTRMKAATAQKLILTAFSTALAVRLGRTFSNLMVDMAAGNAKLRGRSLAILEEATGHPEHECATSLAAAGGELKTALVCLLAGCGPDEARDRLRAAGGRAREAAAHPIGQA